MKITSNRRAAVAIKVLVLVGIAFMVNLWAVNSLRSDNANNLISEVGPENKASSFGTKSIITTGRVVQGIYLGASPVGNIASDLGFWSIGKNGSALALLVKKDQLSSSVTTHFPIIKKYAFDTAVDGYLYGTALSNGAGVKALIRIAAPYCKYPNIISASQSQKDNDSLLFNADVSSDKPARRMSDVAIVSSVVATQLLLKTSCVQDGLVHPAVKVFEEVVLEDKNCSQEDHEALMELANFILSVCLGELAGHCVNYGLQSLCDNTGVSQSIHAFFSANHKNAK